MSEPTLAEIFRLFGDARERELFTALVGVVEKYDPGLVPPGPPTVDVLPVIKRPIKAAGPGGALLHEELPVITNVPVLFPSASGMSMTWPISKGDHVLLVCTNWSHQQWRETGSVSEPGDLRTHEVGNAFAIAGVLPKSGTLPTALDAAVIEVNAPVTHLKVGNGGADEFVVLVDKLVTAFNNHDHTETGATTGKPNQLYMASAIAATKLKSE